MKRLFAALIAATAVAFAHQASAQDDWPNRVIRIVVPYPAGGATDVMGRLAADALSQAIGQRAFVDNKGGASGAIGTAEVERAAPDGYTFLVATPATHVTNQYLKDKLPYDPEKFDPVVILSRSPMLVVVHPSVAANSVAELIKLAKQSPGKLNFGSSGVGATSHLAPELFKKMADVDIVHVPYRGAGPAMTGLLGGQVEIMFDNMQTALPQVTGGKLRALGVTGAQRLPTLPEVPAVGETVAGYEALSFLALMAPKGTPKPIIDKVNAAIQTAFKDPQMQQRLIQLGLDPVTGTPEELGAFIVSERNKWGPLIRERGIKEN